jgi:hypothetical protein
MLNTTKWGAQGALGAGATALATTLRLETGQGTRFGPLPAGDHFYLTLKSGGVTERVRVTAVAGDTLTVIRGVDNTSAVAFPTGACVSFEWNPAQLCEFATSCAVTAALPNTGVTPGTYCTNCTTCFEVGADGRIKNVNGATTC